MNLTAGPYVNVPDPQKLTDNNLQYLDFLIYASLRSFNHNRWEECFPMHETIAQRAGMSKRFVINSIKRLEKADLITVERSDELRISNQYSFTEKQGRFYLSTHKVPVALFEANDLTANEKAMFICLRQFYNFGKLACVEPVTFFAKWLELSYDTVKKQYSSLIKKGYIAERMIFTNSKYWRTKSYFTDKLNWDYYDIVKAVPKEPSLIMVA